MVNKKIAFTLAEVFFHPTEQSKRIGFTLAEVLITLGIIGVVAALTMPSLINNAKNKELETAFKKSYSNLSNAFQRMYLEDYNGTEIDYDLSKMVNNLQKYYAKTSACINGHTGCSTSVFPMENFEGADSGNFLMTNYKSYNAQSFALGYCNDGIMSVSDGSFIYFDVSTPSQVDDFGNFYICVDTNGWKKKPNKLGHDFFLFQVNQKNGKLYPMGLNGTRFHKDTYCSLSSNARENGYGCTAKALSDKDYFKNLPK